IRDWEFWNEPEGRCPRPAAERNCWTGTGEEFLEFYRHVAPALKATDPTIHVGLAGFTNGRIRAMVAPAGEANMLTPGWRGVLPACVAEGLPVDFVSWHTYANDWSQVAGLAARVREFLDRIGLAQAESHLTEWSFDPVLVDEEGEFTFMQA